MLIFTDENNNRYSDSDDHYNGSPMSLVHSSMDLADIDNRSSPSKVKVLGGNMIVPVWPWAVDVDV